MLSTQYENLQPQETWRRQHQRQNSAPTFAASYQMPFPYEFDQQLAMATMQNFGLMEGQVPKTPSRQTKTSNFPMTPGTTPLKRSADFADYDLEAQPSPTKKPRKIAAPKSVSMQRARSLQGVVGTTASFGDFNFTEAQGFGKAPKVAIPPATPLLPKFESASQPTSPTKAALSPRATTLGDLNLDADFDASIEDTGITLDDIATHIQGPDVTDNKWVCTFAGCNKRFGRKENIKSHVQTHLGDRQFKCNHCNKCFVRAHDLKRHAKIHTGVKPYQCDCGNTFARQDALTRHRQRGMCVGAFDGAVKKDMKRGRPRKIKPEGGEKQTKASKPRRGVSSNASAEGTPCPESSADELVNSLTGSRESSASVESQSQLGPIQLLPGEGYGLPPNVFTFTPPSSPGYSGANKFSPARTIRTLTPSEDELMPVSPTKHGLPSILEEDVNPPLAPLVLDAFRRGSNSSLSDFAQSSPTAPTLLETSSNPDFERLTSRETTISFDEGHLSDLSRSGLPSLPESTSSSYGPKFPSDALDDAFFSTGDDPFWDQFQIL
ncbi:Metallothionein expression activator [Arachnomyces sp. PD_36]|nr:Metallothionein expression activator [Arachnomyces sp. PD_36]